MSISLVYCFISSVLKVKKKEGARSPLYGYVACIPIVAVATLAGVQLNTPVAVAILVHSTATVSPVKYTLAFVRVGESIATAGVAPNTFAENIQSWNSIALSISPSAAIFTIDVVVPPAFFQNLQPSNNTSLDVPTVSTTDPSTNTAGLILSPETASANDPNVQFLNSGESPPSTNSATVSEPRFVEL